MTAAVAAALVLSLGLAWWWSLVAGVNAAVVVLYGWDKRAARRGGSRARVPEVVLHGFMFLGGTPGAWVSQRVFRHKTVKGSFRVVFWVLVAVQLAVLGALFLPR